MACKAQHEYFKHLSIIDYKEIGTIQLRASTVVTEIRGVVQEYKLEREKIVLLYNNYRGGYVRRGESSNGINELWIGGHRIPFLISKDREIDQLKSILQSWYKSNFDLSEFTRDQNRDRLIELDLNFEWKRLVEIKKNNK